MNPAQSKLGLVADLHTHSRHSYATSRDLNVDNMAFWAARKGIDVLASGDCLHPAWRAELQEKLVAEGNGLFVLRTPPSAPWPQHEVRFMLSTEVSTIYRQGDRTRKVHHLIYAADFSTFDRLARRLAAFGRLDTDGRPTLAVDSRRLLEMVLEAGDDAYLVPAHIWTPWFSVLGSKSGFDSIDECYGDLATEVFALETGLSSDPPMNWRVSSLDRFRLISSSDAHSPARFGREATRFACAADFFAIKQALRSGDGYLGTVEFFPEEGKYHLDGHRNCAVCLSPEATIAYGGVCPACGKAVTVGTAHRIATLADRFDGSRPATAGDVIHLLALDEVIAEILGCSAATLGVGRAYERVVAALGAELPILHSRPLDELHRLHPLLGEAISRLRQGKVSRTPGYDGKYGRIRLFADDELAGVKQRRQLFAHL